MRKHLQAHELYEKDGYAPLPAFLSKQLVRTVYERTVQELNLQKPRQEFVAQGNLLTKPAIEVYSHIYPPLAGFLWGMTPAIEAHVGKRLVPSYAYFRIYQRGDVCKVHSDRHACEHSLSLMLAASDGAAWGLSVGKTRRAEPSGDVSTDFDGETYGTVPMVPGDAVIYQGVHHRHGRLEPNPNAWSAHAFLHWVDPAGPYAEQAFDRPTLSKAQHR
ncbi:MAG: hypothetical protein MK104_05590 [Erythrobacter sp.]|jgi:hypothetical protein|uniref:hypothetical protein n=1 Tax=Qipengyuania pacifica TaxID=2860199 RepID=UPI0035C82019|nr:hypothetical protein [Erythrobacter sp.]